MSTLQEQIYTSNNLSMMGILEQRKRDDKETLKKYNKMMRVLDSIKDDVKIVNKRKQKESILCQLKNINHKRK